MKVVPSNECISGSFSTQLFFRPFQLLEYVIPPPAAPLWDVFGKMTIIQTHKYSFILSSFANPPCGMLLERCCERCAFQIVSPESALYRIPPAERRAQIISKIYFIFGEGKKQTPPSWRLKHIFHLFLSQTNCTRVYFPFEENSWHALNKKEMCAIYTFLHPPTCQHSNYQNVQTKNYQHLFGNIKN